MTNRYACIVPMRSPTKPAILTELESQFLRGFAVGKPKEYDGDRFSGTAEVSHRCKTGMDGGCCRQTVTSKMTSLVEAV